MRPSLPRAYILDSTRRGGLPSAPSRAPGSRVHHLGIENNCCDCKLLFGAFQRLDRADPISPPSEDALARRPAGRHRPRALEARRRPSRPGGGTRQPGKGERLGSVCMLYNNLYERVHPITLGRLRGEARVRVHARSFALAKRAKEAPRPRSLSAQEPLEPLKPLGLCLCQPQLFEASRPGSRGLAPRPRVPVEGLRRAGRRPLGGSASDEAQESAVGCGSAGSSGYRIFELRKPIVSSPASLPSTASVASCGRRPLELCMEVSGQVRGDASRGASACK
jgi:hypothetical protein